RPRGVRYHHRATPQAATSGQRDRSWSPAGNQNQARPEAPPQHRSRARARRPGDAGAAGASAPDAPFHPGRAEVGRAPHAHKSNSPARTSPPPEGTPARTTHRVSSASPPAATSQSTQVASSEARGRRSEVREEGPSADL